MTGPHTQPAGRAPAPAGPGPRRRPPRRAAVAGALAAAALSGVLLICVPHGGRAVAAASGLAASADDPPATADEDGRVISAEVREASALSFEGSVLVTVEHARTLAAGMAAGALPRLFIDGREVDGAQLVRDDLSTTGDGLLEFFVMRAASTEQVWGDLVALHRSFTERLSVSVGLPGQIPLPSDRLITVVLARRAWFVGVLAIILTLLGTLIVLAARTDLLRDAGTRTWSDDRPPSWSLSRLTMAAWTISVLAGWLVLYVFRHTMDTIPDALVSLTGLSAGTTLTASAIEHRETRAARPTSGIVKDLLVVDGGMSFHRFQLLAWNVVALVVLWRQILMFFQMPAYPTSVLLLMGISSASYLGGKYTESGPAAAADAATTTDPT